MAGAGSAGWTGDVDHDERARRRQMREIV